MESPVGGGAVGRVDSLHATAEIEGEESEVVCIDTPTQPQCDLISLLHEVTPLPLQHADSGSSLTFTEIFISIFEEYSHAEVYQHECDLISEYQRNNTDSIVAQESSGDAKMLKEEEEEEEDDDKYEKSIPKHGDKMFYELVMRMQKNPGQILRLRFFYIYADICLYICI